MPSCSAINCFNRNEGSNKVSLYRYPTDKTRREKWVQNIGRPFYTPGPSSRLCEVHFEKSQYEPNRADGKKKLKPNAVPTLFDYSFRPEKARTEPSLCKIPSNNSTPIGIPIFGGEHIMLTQGLSLKSPRNLKTDPLREKNMNLQIKEPMLGEEDLWTEDITWLENEQEELRDYLQSMRIMPSSIENDDFDVMEILKPIYNEIVDMQIKLNDCKKLAEDIIKGCSVTALPININNL